MGLHKLRSVECNAFGLLPMVAAFLAMPAAGQDVDVVLTQGLSPDPFTMNVIAGGSDGIAGDPDIAGEGGCTFGYSSSERTISVDSHQQVVADLFIYAESDADTMLIVLDKDGYRCDDDSHVGLNPLVVVPNPDHLAYRPLAVAVGTLDGGSAPATLYFSERDPRVGSSPVGVNTAARATGIDLNNPEVQELLDSLGADVVLEDDAFAMPHFSGVLAGGGESFSDCVGSFPEKPSYVVVLVNNNLSGSNSDIYIYVESDTDTTLRVELDMSALPCDDDGHTGVNPLVIVPGGLSVNVHLLDVYVGTYGGGGALATLYISETAP